MVERDVGAESFGWRYWKGCLKSITLYHPERWCFPVVHVSFDRHLSHLNRKVIRWSNCRVADPDLVDSVTHEALMVMWPSCHRPDGTRPCTSRRPRSMNHKTQNPGIARLVSTTIHFLRAIHHDRTTQAARPARHPGRRAAVGRYREPKTTGHWTAALTGSPRIDARSARQFIKRKQNGWLVTWVHWICRRRGA